MGQGALWGSERPLCLVGLALGKALGSGWSGGCRGAYGGIPTCD